MEKNLNTQLFKAGGENNKCTSLRGSIKANRPKRIKLLMDSDVNIEEEDREITITKKKLKEIKKTFMGKNIKESEKLNIWIEKASSLSERKFSNIYNFNFTTFHMKEFYKAVNV